MFWYNGADFSFFGILLQVKLGKSNDVCHEYTGVLLLLPLIEKK